MSFLTILYTLIIRPLELLFEVIFTISNRFIHNPGLSIIALSLAVNFLVLPLYKRADELQAEERDRQKDLEHWTKHIKKTFKGDKRFMILQTYYRQKHYKPIYALNGMISLLLQVPFFIAAYNFLSNLSIIKGMSFGPIRDLGVQDAMFTIGGFPINVLPIAMTLINIISGAIYTKGHPLKAKLQIYGVALVFLVLLYNSPSGLVFYWLLNNVFSLVKNLFYKLKNPKKVLSIMASVVGILLLLVTMISGGFTIKQKILFAGIAVLLQIPVGLIYLLPRMKKKERTEQPEEGKDINYIFLAGGLFLSVLLGILIPANVIKASVAEFIDMLDLANPSLYVAYSFLLALGTFVVWAGIFYFLADKKIRVVFSACIWLMCGMAIVNHMLFGTNLGVLYSNLQYETAPVFTIKDYLLNLLAMALVVGVFFVIFAKKKTIVKGILTIGVITLAGIGMYHISKINSEYKNYERTQQNSTEEARIHLSKNGKNVIVFMLDRAMGPMVPYIMKEKPELVEKYDGFVYYPNTLSYGQFTNFAAPAVFGGYEYTPERINARADETLEEKNDEALKVLPVLFDNNGYDVTVCDPPYAGYDLIPDITIYDEYPDIHKYITDGKYNVAQDTVHEMTEKIRRRNFFCYSIMRTVPLLIQGTVYNNGFYNEGEILEGDVSYVQSMDGLSKSVGYSQLFLNGYSVLVNLPEMTEITDDDENTFLMMENGATHEPCLLQEPDYVPQMVVDNTAYDVNMEERYNIDGQVLKMELDKQVIHYHANIASLDVFAKWLDYLRENDLYDNTRIILVSDHGRNLEHFDMTLANGEDAEFFMPLMMVKDFDAHGFTTSDEFMTNADVPVLATKDVIDNPVNPFTGGAIDGHEKEGKQTVFSSRDFDIRENCGNTFKPGSWFTVYDNIHDLDKWEYLGDY